MGMNPALALGAGLVLLTGSIALAQDEDARSMVSRANRLFAEGEFVAALEAYREAEVTLPESPELAYNQGVAHYKLGDYSQARDAFNRALLTRDLGLEAKIKFNLGDVAYASALEKQADLQEAIDLLKTAVGHYRDALELDPEDQDAKANIQMAQLLFKDLLDKLKQQQEQQQQDQDQQQQDNQDQQQENQQQDQQSEEGQQQGDPQGTPDGDQQQNDEQQQDQPQPGSEEQQEHEQQDQGGRPRAAEELTPEQAEQLLQSVRDKERQRREELAQRRRARRVPVLKDW